MKKLVAIGDNKFDTPALPENLSAEIIVGRRTETQVTEDYLPCQHCYKYVLARNLYHHASSPCLAADGKKISVQERRLQLLTNLVDSKVNQAVVELFSSMQHDEIQLLVRNDRYLKLYASVQLEKIERARVGKGE